MSETPPCPQCTLSDALVGPDGFECQTCGYEWEAAPSVGFDDVVDVNGTPLASGDTVTIIKELKLDGKSGGVKMGTKVKSIRLVEGDHPISGKVEGRSILIKPEFVKKAK